MTRIEVELVRSERPWYANHDNLADLYAYLQSTAPTTDFEYLLRKPWKWDADYEAMRREEELERLHEEQCAREDEAWRDMERRSAL